VCLNLVNLGTGSANLVIRAYRADGTEAAPAANVPLPAMRQYTKNLAEIFGQDPGPVSLVVETSSLALVGDVLLSDSTPEDRYRAAIALTSTPQKSLVVPYVAGDGTTVTSVALSNASAATANAKLTLFAPGGSQVASTTVKVGPNASQAGTLASLFSGALAGAYVTVSSDQPVTAMALIDPGVRDVAAVPGLAMPGTESVGPGVTLAPAISVPGTLDFGSVTVGQSQDLTVTVRNNGTAALTVSALTVTGAAFRVTGPRLRFRSRWEDRKP
jgi:hypothetical protein